MSGRISGAMLQTTHKPQTLHAYLTYNTCGTGMLSISFTTNGMRDQTNTIKDPSNTYILWSNVGFIVSVRLHKISVERSVHSCVMYCTYVWIGRCTVRMYVCTVCTACTSVKEYEKCEDGVTVERM